MPTQSRSTQDLMRDIRDFCEVYGIAASTFGRHAVNDGKFVSRIEDGSWITPETEDRVDQFMARVRAGEIVLRGRPKRKLEQSHAEKMQELIARETSVRTAGSMNYLEQRQRLHVFSNTTNEAWMLADRASAELAEITPSKDGMRLFYAPMDNGIAMTRILRFVHSRHPDTPILTVMKGRGIEDLRNTMGRLVDRLAEHPLSVVVMTNMYLNEAVDLTKRSDDNPSDVSWHDVALEGADSFAFQKQVSQLFQDVSSDWRVKSGAHGQPVYTKPSVICIYRKDRAAALKDIIPTPGASDLRYDYALLNHPYLHTHTMPFRTDYILKPVAERLGVGGRMSVVQSLGQDPAHEIVARLWPDQTIPTTHRHDIISALRKTITKGDFAFSGLTDTNALFRFDMHTLPVDRDDDIGALLLSSAWNNAVYYVQVREDLAQAALQAGPAYLDITRDVLKEFGGLWFVNETFSVTRRAEGT